LPIFVLLTRRGRSWVGGMTPIPAFPQIGPAKKQRDRRSDLGEGEYYIWMNILFVAQHEITPPPIVVFNSGRLGRGSNA
jgi:hypothetical protein